MDIKEIHLGDDELNGYKVRESSFVNLDFKVVSFNIGDDNYLIDIMKVKEIRKSGNFTYVPNARKYVVGLDNLRGEIISIIDLRVMFNLKTSEKELEDIMVLRNEDLLIGIIVDKVNNVFSIDSSLIQDPHPVLSQDAFIKYIKGVVEHEGKLYILLDIDKVFNYDEEDEGLLAGETSVDLPVEENLIELTEPFNDFIDDLKVMRDGLSQYSFNTSLVNSEFLREVGIKLGIAGINDESYGRFLGEFYSRSAGRLWDDSYLREFQNEVVERFVGGIGGAGSILNVFEVGCGDGKETVSFVNALCESYKKLLRVTAIDNDLTKVIGTSNLVFSEAEIGLSEIYRKNSFEQRPGLYKFKAEIMNNILFEYSDAILSEFPEDLGIIFLRDVLCFFNNEEQALILDTIAKKTVSGALLILGDNEKLKDNDIFVKERSVEHFNLYKKI
ncbi:CheR family methyltransferase [Borrelia sp. P9F1]|uniref:CheR family methyltransferase n=1 Tax=Borrelia sp. P9F1 TaxID=3058374 RepID=UPI0026474A3B|nr:CheR family methyltransferase [Borrelia sp. P9F1]WKC58438.1 CheR family methyltransferase [Borrelia sp. P9F1]